MKEKETLFGFGKIVGLMKLFSESIFKCMSIPLLRKLN